MGRADAARPGAESNSAQDHVDSGCTRSPDAKRAWHAPRIDALPPLARLTLVTPEVSEEDSLGDGIQGNMSSVFPDPI